MARFIHTHHIMGALLLGIGLLCSGCGGGNSSGGTTTPPSPMTLNPTGGTIHSGDNAVTLVAPDGAVPQATTVTITATSAVPADTDVVTGTTYQFGPDGTQFQHPVQLTLSYDPAKLVSGVAEADLQLATVSSGVWQAVDGSTVDTTAHTVSAPVSHFSIYGVWNNPAASRTQWDAYAGYRSTQGADGVWYYRYQDPALSGTTLLPLVFGPSPMTGTASWYAARGSCCFFNNSSDVSRAGHLVAKTQPNVYVQNPVLTWRAPRAMTAYITVTTYHDDTIQGDDVTSATLTIPGVTPNGDVNTWSSGTQSFNLTFNGNYLVPFDMTVTAQ